MLKAKCLRCIIRIESSWKVNDLVIHFKNLEKEQKINSKNVDRKKQIQVRVETNEVENKCTMDKTQKSKYYILKIIIHLIGSWKG